MSHNENTSRNVINILSDFQNISIFTLGSYPRSYDSEGACYYPFFKRGVICCGC